MKCSFTSCENIANQKLKNGKGVCEKHYNYIQNRSRNIGKGRKGIKNSKAILIEKEEFLCSFGCGEKAKYYFPTTKKYCCNDNVSKCSKVSSKISNGLKGHITSEETKKKISEKIKYISKYNEDYKIKQSNSRKVNANYYKVRYPFFSKIEEIRDNSETGKIEVRCKNSNCNKWFTPKGTALYERIRQLESNTGKDGCYLYCSEECKNTCPLFNLIPKDFHKEKIKNELPYTDKEYYDFRLFVLERDNYRCQYCGNPAEHVHHERPQKLEPFFSLDPDYAWAVCSKCHYEKGHKDECSTGKLANQVCMETI